MKSYEGFSSLGRTFDTSWETRRTALKVRGDSTLPQKYCILCRDVRQIILAGVVHENLPRRSAYVF